MKRRTSLSILLSLALAVSSAFAGHHDKKDKYANDIVDTAVKAGSFTTLVAAVKAAGLVETLKGEGPFTVFAPSDDAFAKLPDGTVENLLKPENKDRLVAILTYHVVPGKVTADQVVKIDNAETVNGQSVNVRVESDGVLINEAKVLKTDIAASNGVIHVIDRVLLPAEHGAAETSSLHHSPLELIEMAIQRGVPHFNNGEPATTVDIYAGTVKTLLANGSSLSADTKRFLHDALVCTYHMSDDAKKAWVLRIALDKTHSQLRNGSLNRI